MSILLAQEYTCTTAGIEILGKPPGHAAERVSAPHA
jgi:hypothetical protein